MIQPHLHIMKEPSVHPGIPSQACTSSLNAPFHVPTLGENPWARMIVGSSGLNENRSDGLKISWKLDISVVLIVFDFSLKVMTSVVSMQVAV